MLTGLPRPVANLDTLVFWEGVSQRRFLFQRCANCGSTRWPPGPCCPVCHSFHYSWDESAGRGTIYSWIVVHHAAHPALSNQVPYAVALVRLDEGLRVVGNVKTADYSALSESARVVMIFEETDGFVLPNFELEVAVQH